jgi:multimeric flavodoxin WrbA
MKIIGFIGSSRQNGNTSYAVNKILEAAEKQGAEVQSFCFGDIEIGPCCGCSSCKKGAGVCIINDDMQKIYASLKDANAIILGSPVYMGQMSAQAKIFTDRLYACFMPKFSPYYKEGAPKKRMALVFTQGNPDANLFKAYFDYTKNMFQMLEFDVKGVWVAAGMRNGPLSERNDFFDTAKDIACALMQES